MASPKKDRRGGVVTRERGAKGRFVKVTTFPDTFDRVGRKGTSGYVIINTHGLKAATSDLKRLNAAISQVVLDDPEKRAAQIQARLRLAVGLAYNKASTGRLQRGIFARTEKVGTADGKGIQTAIVVSMINYREARFVTNLGGEGHFRTFPVQPYRIFAKGAEGLDDLRNPATGIRSKTSARKAIRAGLALGDVGRLKVPRGSAFFTSRREQGRGGGEKRIINDMFGEADFSPNKSFPNLTADPKGAFFFYPLWVNHPGFPQDVISEIAKQEGSTFTVEAIEAVALKVEQFGRTGANVRQRLPESDVVVSGIIPLPGTEVVQAARSYYSRSGLRQREATTVRGFTNEFGELIGSYPGGTPQGNFTVGFSGRRRQ